MLKNIFLKTLKDKRNSLIWWSVGISLTIIFYMYFYPQFAKSQILLFQLTKMYQEIPFVKMFIGETLDFTSPEGFINAEFFSFMGPLLFLVFALSFGSDSIAGEEERKTLELLLANPIQRWKILLEKFSAMSFSIFILGGISFISFILGILIFEVDVSLLRLLEALLSLCLFSILFGTLALTVGSLKGRKGLNIGFSSTIAIISYLLNSLSFLADFMKPYRKFSFFYYYIGNDPIKNRLNPAHILVFLVSIGILLALSIIVFEKRDIAV